MTAGSNEPRTYGNWRAGRAAGLFGLGPVQTGIGFGVVALAMLMVLVSLWVSAAVLGVGGIVLIPLAVRDRAGRTGLQVLGARLAWMLGTWRRHHVYQSGVASRVTGQHRLPGILARSEVWEVETGRWGRIGVVVVPQSRHYSVTLRLDTDGTDLVDEHVVDARVAHYGQWLAMLAREQMLVQAQVTVETTPDPGHRLSTEVVSTTTAAAPALAREVLDEVVRTYPTGSASVETRATLTFRAAAAGKSRAYGPDEMCQEIASRLPALHRGLLGAGVSGIRPMSPAALSAAVRAAFDPAAGAELARAHNIELDWANAGPVSAREEWDHYRHDSGVSVTWGMVQAPQGVVFSNLLQRLTGPDPVLTRKRVTLLYRPIGPAEATRLVERDRRTARWHGNKEGPRLTAATKLDMQAADRTADEVARGAGMTRFSVLVTATVRSAEELETAARAIEAAAGEARLVMRRMDGCQASTFAVGLPAGVVLPVHATIPF